MFRDAREELKRLEEELLQEEENGGEGYEEEALEEEECEEDGAPSFYDPDRIYNSDDVDADPEELSEAVLRPRKKSGLGVAICLLLLAATLLLVAATVLYLRG